jgi:hypothetical protein
VSRGIAVDDCKCAQCYRKLISCLSLPFLFICTYPKTSSEQHINPKLKPLNMAEISDTEKSAPTQLESALSPSPPTEDIDLDAIGEQNGYIVDVSLILIPQPSEDPHDPLNWSSWRKHITLIVISMTAFLPDYGSATGAVALIPQSKLVFPAPFPPHFLPYVPTGIWANV